MNSEVLEVTDLSTGYNRTTILRNVSFSINQDDVLALIGQNGSGKSTLLKTLSGLLPLQTGTVKYHGSQIKVPKPHDLVKQGISFFSQGGLIMPALTVAEHLELTALQCGGELSKSSLDLIFAEFPRLQERMKSRAGNLSGGERQMLSFGILMIQDTKLWFLDEPTAGLSDPQMVDLTINFLKSKKGRGITMLLVEHNMRVVSELATHVIGTRDGTLTQKFNYQEFDTEDALFNIVYN